MPVDKIPSAGIDAGGVAPSNLSTGAPYWDASGNVGIGTSSPDGNLQVFKNAASSLIRVTSSTTGVTGVDFGDTDASDRGQVRYFNNGDYLLFATAATERARIDSNGYLLLNRTSALNSSRIAYDFNGLSGFQGINSNNSTGGGANHFNILTNGTSYGSITSSTTGTGFNTTSDYRLKEDIQPMTGALAKVAALKPCTYKWKLDGSDGEGFIAHELAEVCPQAVSGEKDAVDSEGNIKPQGIDTSFLVATLTAAIQELKAEVDSLRAQVEAK